MALTAAVHITTALRGEGTFLKASFCSPPFKVANVSEGSAKNLKLMLMNASPGVLDGDDYSLQINVAEATCLELQTQSYQRLFQMQEGAVQTMQVMVESGATFVYMPHPTVPHKASIFKARNKINLHKSSTLIWGEVISCGRKLNGEVFQFTSYQGITEIWMNEQLVVKENILLQPTKCDLTSIGQLEGYTHQASLICITEKAEMETLMDTLIKTLCNEKNIAYGISALPVNGLVLRLLGYKAEQLFGLLQRAAAIMEYTHQKEKTYAG